MSEDPGDLETGRQGEISKILKHQDLTVYRKAFEASMPIFDVTKTFPKEETYSLTDQVRRSSRSVSANVAEAWRKRRYTAAFIAKLNDAEGEAAETETGSNMQFAVNILTEKQQNICFSNTKKYWRSWSQ